jgi:hypothetical protein
VTNTFTTIPEALTPNLEGNYTITVILMDSEGASSQYKITVQAIMLAAPTEQIKDYNGILRVDGELLQPCDSDFVGLSPYSGCSLSRPQSSNLSDLTARLEAV